LGQKRAETLSQEVFHSALCPLSQSRQACIDQSHPVDERTFDGPLRSDTLGKRRAIYLQALGIERFRTGKDRLAYHSVLFRTILEAGKVQRDLNQPHRFVRQELNEPIQNLQ
jgi:hypothetical protein